MGRADLRESGGTGRPSANGPTAAGTARGRPPSARSARRPPRESVVRRLSGPARRPLLALLAVLALGTAAACGAANPPKQLSPEGKYQWARERYAAGDYGAAAKGFKAFLLASPLDPRADSAQFLLGQSYFQNGKYEQAADAFDRLGTNRPTSEVADDALLGVCRSYWELSPELALAQDYTHQAQDACGRLLQYYPDSPLSDSAQALQERARDKLAAKAYKVGKWYYDQGIFESANVYFQMVLNNYPKAPIVPDVLASLYHSYRKIGFDSEASDIRHRLLTEYADSRAARRLKGETSGQGAE